MDYRSLAKSASGRREALKAKVASTKEELVAMEKELIVLDGLLKAIPAGAVKRGPGRPRGKRATKKAGKRAGKKGKWRPGSRGRKPQWYLDQQKAVSGAKKTARAKPAKKKRKASEKQLAALARAREVRAANREAELKAKAP